MFTGRIKLFYNNIFIPETSIVGSLLLNLSVILVSMFGRITKMYHVFSEVSFSVQEICTSKCNRKWTLLKKGIFKQIVSLLDISGINVISQKKKALLPNNEKICVVMKIRTICYRLHSCVIFITTQVFSLLGRRVCFF